MTATFEKLTQKNIMLDPQSVERCEMELNTARGLLSEAEKQLAAAQAEVTRLSALHTTTNQQVKVFAAELKMYKNQALSQETTLGADAARDAWKQMERAQVGYRRGCEVLTYLVSFAMPDAALALMEAERAERMCTANLFRAKGALLRLKLLTAVAESGALEADAGAQINLGSSQSHSLFADANKISEQVRRGIDPAIRAHKERVKREREDVSVRLFGQ